MRLAVTVLGLDLFSVEITTGDEAEDEDKRGDCVTNPVGFTASAGDQRWSEHSTPSLD